ncbi:hypothetical protein GCM10010302_06620 [Streptomyces polychromogenes]|uniref:Uncharacterized protein n=1 Tax=Streptomyces polychromogenes TaxID=67342 RepID=A0ABP3EQX7_9ACTN
MNIAQPPSRTRPPPGKGGFVIVRSPDPHTTPGPHAAVTRPNGRAGQLRRNGAALSAWRPWTGPRMITGRYGIKPSPARDARPDHQAAPPGGPLGLPAPAADDPLPAARAQGPARSTR